MSEAAPIIEPAKLKISPIWIVPIVAVCLGVFLAVQAYLEQGPTVQLTFTDAEGIAPEKTKVKALDVDIGVVTRVRLADDLQGVIVTAELAPEARQLLREDTQFWVVRARVQGGSITGLGTLLSGSYIEVAPGVGEVVSTREFVALDEAPATPVGTPGLRLQLTSATSGSVTVGSPVLYRGYRVGTVETVNMDVEEQQVSYSIFVDAPYDQLINSSTRFWNASGISAELSTEGIKVSIGSLQSALMGGIAFDLPRDTTPGEPVPSDTSFRLYPDESSIHEDPHRYHAEYVVGFTQSLRGLHPGAPVDYRGITIGRVERILLEELSQGSGDVGQPLQVLIRIEPGRMAIGDTPEAVDLARQAIELGVARGLRASLQSGNLLTGALYVELDYYEGLETDQVGRFLDYPTIPTTQSGFEQIQAQISTLLDKLNRLPLEGTLASATKAFDQLSSTLTSLRDLLAKEETQAIPGEINAAMDSLQELLASYSADSQFSAEVNATLMELKALLERVGALAERIREQPNALVFPSTPQADPEPKAR